MRIFNKLFSSLSAIVVISFLSFGTSSADDLVYVRAGTLIDVQSGRLSQDQLITIRGDRIESVDDVNDINIEPDSILIDLGDGYVMPGLIDLHDHLTGDHRYHGYKGLQFSVPRQTLFGVTNARKTLDAGFTTV